MDLQLAFQPYATLGWELILKGSFDKANRTRQESPRGIGLELGLDALDRASQLTGLRVLTDVHETWQVEEVAHVVDVIQIPALLGKQTDLIHTAALSGCVVNIKKPQYMESADVRSMCQKASEAPETWLTYRGTLQGACRLIVDPLDLGPLVSREKKDFDRVILDITHTNRGIKSATIPLAGLGVLCGIRGFFMEVHPEPTKATCDGPHQLTMSYFIETLEQIRKLNALR